MWWADWKVGTIPIQDSKSQADRQIEICLCSIQILDIIWINLKYAYSTEEYEYIRNKRHSGFIQL